MYRGWLLLLEVEYTKRPFCGKIDVAAQERPGVFYHKRPQGAMAGGLSRQGGMSETKASVRMLAEYAYVLPK